MISPVSSASTAHLEQTPASRSQQQIPAKPAQEKEDSVQLSVHAKAAASQGVDHDRDSH
jgi:hypothetical protein